MLYRIVAVPFCSGNMFTLNLPPSAIRKFSTPDCLNCKNRSPFSWARNDYRHCFQSNFFCFSFLIRLLVCRLYVVLEMALFVAYIYEYLSRFSPLKNTVSVILHNIQWVWTRLCQQKLNYSQVPGISRLKPPPQLNKSMEFNIFMWSPASSLSCEHRTTASSE